MSNILKTIVLSVFILSNLSVYANTLFTQEEKDWIKKNPTISINMMNDFVPFSFEKEGIHQGFSVDLLDRISTISGLKFDIKTSKWTEALKGFKEQKADMISGISYTRKREPFTLFTEPFYEISTYIFGLNRKNYKNNESLVGKKVAVTKNVFYKKELQKLGIELVEYDSSILKAKALLNNEVDYFLDSYITGKQVIEQNNFTSIKTIDQFNKIKKEDLRFGINKDKTLLYNIIRKSYLSIPSSEIVTLSTKWIVNTQNNTPENTIIFTKEEREYLKNHPTIKYSEIDWHPLSIIEGNSMKGIMGDFLDIVSKRTGIEFKFIPATSWPNVLEKFQNKEIDLVPGVGSSPQEKELGLISDIYASYPMVIVTGQKYTFLDDLSALNGKTVAVPKYYTSYNFITKNYPNIKILATEDIPKALLKVKNGEAEAFVGHISTSLYYLSKLYLNDLKVAGNTFFDFEHRYLIQKSDPLLLSIINKAFNSITHQEKQKIYSNWVQTTVVENRINYTLLYILLFIIFILIVFFSYRQYILKKYTQNLEDSYTQIEGILNASVEAVIITENHKCIDFNNSAQHLFKIDKKSEGVGTSIFDFISEESVELIKHNLLKEETEPYEVDLVKADKTVFPAIVKGTNLLLKNKNLRIVSVVDLTEVKSQEKIYLEQTKLASLGEMIGNIAHQWRQPLSVISSAATGLKIQKEFDNLSDENFNYLCDSINDNAQYLSKTIDDFRNFIKGDRDKVQFNLNETFTSFLNLVRGSIKTHNINLIQNIQEDITIKGYPNELIQCFMNIFNNAKDALAQNKDNKYILITIKTKNNQVIISFQDNGSGIKEENLEKIFEPYFTTKHQSQGTGIGLHMTYNLITNGMNGTIKASNTTFTYENKEYKGALFTIKLNL